MAEKVARVGVSRDNNFMYYIKGGDVWRVKRKQPGVPKGRAEKVASTGATMDNNFIYFLDKDGDVARAKRAVGGQKRKAKKAAAKAKPKAKAKAKPKKAAKKKGKKR
jgi:hypothetical protein